MKKLDVPLTTEQTQLIVGDSGEELVAPLGEQSGSEPASEPAAEPAPNYVTPGFGGWRPHRPRRRRPRKPTRAETTVAIAGMYVAFIKSAGAA